MAALRMHAAAVAEELTSHPACCGQLAHGAAWVDVRPDFTTAPGAAPVVLDLALDGAMLIGGAAQPIMLGDRAPNTVRDDLFAPTSHSRFAPDYHGARWAKREQETPDGAAATQHSNSSPWALHTVDLVQHYSRQQQKKRAKNDTSSYAESLLEQLVAAALAQSPLHAWYARVTPRSNSRHLTYNFLQEVAIAEHAMLLRAALRGTHAISAVVDFGGGNGILAYAAGQRLQVDQIVVDAFTPGFTADMSAATADPFYRRVTMKIEDMAWASHIAVPAPQCIAISKHLCGSGIDMVLHLCDRDNAWPAALALSSCCHHKCRIHEYVNQRYLRELGITDQATFDAVARKAGWLASENAGWQQLIGATVESLLDLGRVLWLRERGYSAFTVTCMSPFLSPRNKMLVAWRSGGLLPASPMSNCASTDSH
jgi:hypothetical protein